jgi:hypothetical protein
MAIGVVAAVDDKTINLITMIIIIMIRTMMILA